MSRNQEPTLLESLTPPRTIRPESQDAGAHPEDWSWRTAVLDENDIRGEITADWIREGVPCDRTTAPTELLGLLDQAYPLVAIRHTGEWFDDLVRFIWERYPHVQILLLLGRDAFTSVDRECDEQLQEPYGKRELQETVSHLVGRGLYTLKLREYYQLTSYLVCSEGERAATDRSTDGLQEELEAVKAEIDTITSAFDQADFEGVLRGHRTRERALGTPDMAAEEEARSKYRPGTCPECGIAWGTHHGGRLDNGYERVAALVWRCRNCGDVLKISPGEYDKVL